MIVVYGVARAPIGCIGGSEANSLALRKVGLVSGQADIYLESVIDF
jgi:hypothetical protein